MIASLRFNKIKYLQTIGAQTRETHAAPFNEDLGCGLVDILFEASFQAPFRSETKRTSVISAVHAVARLSFVSRVRRRGAFQRWLSGSGSVINT